MAVRADYSKRRNVYPAGYGDRNLLHSHLGVLILLPLLADLVRRAHPPLGRAQRYMPAHIQSNALLALLSALITRYPRAHRLRRREAGRGLG